MTNAMAVLCLLVNVSFVWLCHLQWLNPASSRLLMWEKSVSAVPDDSSQ